MELQTWFWLASGQIGPEKFEYESGVISEYNAEAAFDKAQEIANSMLHGYVVIRQFNKVS